LITPDSHRGKNIINFIVAMILCIFIVIISILTYYKSMGKEVDKMEISNVLSLKNIVDTAKEFSGKIEQHIISYSKTDILKFAVYKNNIIKFTNEKIIALNYDGSILWTINVNLKNPISRTNGKELMVADAGGKVVYVIRDRQIKTTINTDDEIIWADINNQGDIVAIQKAKGYSCRVVVYDRLGIEMYRRNVADDIFISAKICDDNKTMFIAGINTKNHELMPALDILDKYGESIFNQRNIQLKPSQAIIIAGVLKNNTAVVAGEKQIIYINTKGDVLWNQDFARIYSCHVSSNYTAVASGGSEIEQLGDKKSKIQVFNINGKEIASFVINEKIKNISIISDTIVLAADDRLLLYDLKGKETGVYVSPYDIRNIEFLNNSQAVLITNSDIRIINLSSIKGDKNVELN